MIIGLCSQSITGNVKSTVLIAEFRIGCRFKSFRIRIQDGPDILIEKEYMSVKLACAAFCACSATKSDFTDNSGEAVNRVHKQVVTLLDQCADAKGNRGQGYENSPRSLMP